MGSIVARLERLEKKHGGADANKCPLCSELPALKFVYTVKGKTLPEFENLPPTICPKCGKRWKEQIITMDFEVDPSDTSCDGKPMSYEQIMEAADRAFNKGKEKA